MAFNNDYIEVHERLTIALEKFPDLSLQADWEYKETPDGRQWIIVKAYAYRTPEDPRPGVGHAWEPFPGQTPFTKNSELMVGETSAWGRALAALGIETKRGIASANEVRARQDQPQTQNTVPRSKPPTNTVTDASAGIKATDAQLNLIDSRLNRMGAKTPDQRKALFMVYLDMENPPTMDRLSKFDAMKILDKMKEAQNG